MSIDNSLLSNFHIQDNENLNDYAMAPIIHNSLVIKNGVMFILGGISSGKSTLLSKLMALYTNVLDPIILSFYGGLAPDETTTYNISTFKIKPYFIKIPTPEAMVSFFDQYKYKRTKLAELLMFVKSVYKDNTKLLCESLTYVNALNIKDKSISDNNKRMQALYTYVLQLIASNNVITSDNTNNNEKTCTNVLYMSEFITKTYAKKKRISFTTDPPLFICHCLMSLASGFKAKTITVDILNEPTVKPNLKNKDVLLNRFHPYTLKPFMRIIKNKGSKSSPKIELVPSVCVFDDLAQFPLLTTEHATQWVKDLLAETRRYMNTFIFAGQRYNLLNKTLRSLTHTFFIGYSLVDDDLPKIAKEMPSNLMSNKDFLTFYNKMIKPFTFIVYNNKLGVNIIKLTR